ncbi:MAG: trypsin-like peptidase domain-containing protein [Novosphingobium sp.]|nr:trypsin-like peptidase domain-containing protein [Novosphingobium sp.]MCB2079638.1 trypsin-like peptidase domain-containing protein [Novosphingobium sp.]
MKRRFVQFVALLVALWAALSSGGVLAEPEDISAAARSVVRVVLVSEQGDEPGLVGHGSGFAVGPDLILTNAHVVQPAREIEEIRIGVVPSQGKNGWFARVVALSPRNDLALLKLTEPGSLPPITLFTGPVADGSEVFAVGYPGNVDLAQGLDVGDIVSPTSPVKTRGNVSAGRSSKQFETILHNAAIGGGNSGGPLLDSCGRVIGANTFGTISDGSDSEFYFAVSTREILRFLRAADVKARSTGIACRSMEDLERAETERIANVQAETEEEARSAEAKQREAEELAQREALMAIIAERETGMVLAGIALLLSLVSGGAVLFFNDSDRPREAKIAGGLAVLLLAGAVTTWLLRPSFSDVTNRADEFAGREETEANPKPATVDLTGKFICALNMARSRVTVSDPIDLELSWREDGCADGSRQFGIGADGWSQVAVSDADSMVTVAHFDPPSGEYRTERYYPTLDVMTQLQAKLKEIKAPKCGAGEEAAAKLAEDQRALIALLPKTPSERMVYDCRNTED